MRLGTWPTVPLPPSKHQTQGPAGEILRFPTQALLRWIPCISPQSKFPKEPLNQGVVGWGKENPHAIFGLSQNWHEVTCLTEDQSFKLIKGAPTLPRS